MGMQQLDSQEAVLLLRSIAEQLKVPLTAISRQVELDALVRRESSDLHSISVHAATALHLVDSYLLGLQLHASQTELTLEPVSVSSLLTEAAHDLHGLAKQYDTDLELHIA